MVPVLQLHPSRACNLRCLHCYSSSGPAERAALGLELLRDALDDAAAEGYRALSVSGGEPLLYPGLEELLHQARALGLVTTVTTNGLLLQPPRLERLRPLLDFLAISVDGAPPTPDRVRARPGAFALMRAQLAEVRRSGVPFGLLFTLRADNLGELPWVARFAADEGARVLQVHPLAEVGRAAAELSGSAPTETDNALAWVAVAHLQRRLGSRLAIHVDLVEAARGAAPVPALQTAGAGLAALVSPLVIEEDGSVVPLQHGFPRAYGLGRLTEGRLTALAARWRLTRAAGFRRLLGRTLRELSAPEAPPLVDWYTELARRAADAPARSGHAPAAEHADLGA